MFAEFNKQCPFIIIFFTPKINFAFILYISNKKKFLKKYCQNGRYAVNELCPDAIISTDNKNLLL